MDSRRVLAGRSVFRIASACIVGDQNHWAVAVIELYILGAIVLIFVGLFAWAKINGARADAEKRKAQAATDRAEIAAQVIAQRNTTDASVLTVIKAGRERQKAELAEIAAGKRDQFDTDW